MEVLLRVVTVKFDEKPSEADPSAVVIKGKVTMMLLKGRERLQLLKELNMAPDSSGNLSFNSDIIGSLIEGSLKLENYLQEIDLSINGVKVTSYEDLEYSSSYVTVVMKLITVMLNGAEHLGNVQLRPLEIKQ